MRAIATDARQRLNLRTVIESGGSVDSATAKEVIQQLNIVLGVRVGTSTEFATATETSQRLNLRAVLESGGLMEFATAKEVHQLLRRLRKDVASGLLMERIHVRMGYQCLRQITGLIYGLRMGFL